MAWETSATAQHGMIAAEASSAARVSFIRKTYLHLGAAVLAFIAIEAALLASPLAQPIVRTFLGGRMSWLVVLGAFMLVGWVADRWARSATSPATQYLGLGLYVVALTLATAGLSIVTGAFNVLLLPRLVQARDAAAQRRIMGETLRYVSLLLTVGTGVLLLLCPGLLPFLFGDAYAGATGLCLVLLLAYLPMALRQVIVHGLCGTGDWRPRILAEGLALGAFAALVWPLAGLLGLLGIPIALLVADLVALAYLLAFLRHRLQLSAPECWGVSPATFRRVWCHGRTLLNGARPVRAHG